MKRILIMILAMVAISCTKPSNRIASQEDIYHTWDAISYTSYNDTVAGSTYNYPAGTQWKISIANVCFYSNPGAQCYPSTSTDSTLDVDLTPNFDYYHFKILLVTSKELKLDEEGVFGAHRIYYLTRN